MQNTLLKTLPGLLLTSLILAVTSGFSQTATAATAATATQNYNEQIQAIDARHANDKKICDAEKSANDRMQCRRDAQALYEEALAQAKQQHAATIPASAPTTAVTNPSTSITAGCTDCGQVLAVDLVRTEGKSSPLGMIAGGVAGAVLGHQVGGGKGKKLATIAGAAGGAYAGHKIAENMNASQHWVVRVRYPNGEERHYSYDQEPGLRVGQQVRPGGKGVVPY